MVENKVKKNADYSASAVNLTNDPDVAAFYFQLKQAMAGLDAANTAIEASVPESLLSERTKLEGEVERLQRELRLAIDAKGSFQDVPVGYYALKQRKVSVTYSPQGVRDAMPDFAKAVIEETVNKAKVEGLLKGGLISQAQVDKASSKTESFAYIIK